MPTVRSWGGAVSYERESPVEWRPSRWGASVGIHTLRPCQYRGTSLIRNRPPLPRTPIGPLAQSYCRVHWRGGSYERGTPVVMKACLLRPRPVGELLKQGNRGTSLIRSRAPPPLGPYSRPVYGPTVVPRRLDLQEGLGPLPRGPVGKACKARTAQEREGPASREGGACLECSMTAQKG